VGFTPALFLLQRPHCNGADRAAVRLSRLGRFVKKMIGGIQGWKDEGYEVVS
jgi:rhodanese-related sulfurtransferase